MIAVIRPIALPCLLALLMPTIAYAQKAPTGPAASAIQAWFRSDRSLDCMDRDGKTVACSAANEPSVEVFYGNADGGPGTPDAVATIIYLGDPTGNAQSAAAAAFHQDAGGRYRLTKRLKGIVGEGIAPGTRAVFDHGKFTMTVIVARPGDSHCCPTGRKQVSFPLR